MTDRERQDEWVREYYAKHPYGEQDANGVDLSLLRSNLRLTPTERLERHRRAALSVLQLRRAGEAHRRRRSTEGP